MTPVYVPPPFPSGAWAIFLDFDGTLVDFASTPAEVLRDAGLIALLARLDAVLHGALAIVSGRSIATLDSLLAPLQLPMAGLHGLERRTADGVLHGHAGDTAWIGPLREALRHHVDAHPGLLLEDKGLSVAVHYRRAREHEAATRSLLQQLCCSLPAEIEMLEGDAVLELRPAACNKGTAVEAFMREPPFAGRRPLFIGDDITDSDAFAFVGRSGGMAIAVGERVPAPWHLAGPMAVREWLGEVVERAHELGRETISGDLR